MNAKNDKYWNEYYASRQVEKNIPTQFAAFVANELSEFEYNFIEFGSGSGRDIFFFCNFARLCIAIERSDIATKKILEKNIDNIIAIGADVASDLLPALKSKLSPLGNGLRVCYSRFFIHAIDEEEEDSHFNVVDEILRVGDFYAAEFRIKDDEFGEKITEPHYRRYVEKATFINKLRSLNFDILYECEGKGFAKYKKDDAHVCRVLAVKK